MMAEEGSCDVVCDLCEDEQAVSFCDECHSKVCTFCQALHVRQKQTYTHNVITLEQVKLLLLNVKCSFCDGQAERFCSECNVRLCTKCAVSHHKRCDIPGSLMQASGDHASGGQEITATYGVSDQTTNSTKNSNEGLSHHSSKILIKDSVPQRSTIIVKDLHIQSGVLCDLCEEEIAACFCEDCQKKMCAFCQQGHMKQKRTKYHKISAVENTKRSILHTICSSCNQHAEKVCNQCEVPFCAKCSDTHHYLTDTLMPRKEISNTEFECEDQVSGRHLRQGSLVYKSDIMKKTSLLPKSGKNQEGFHQVVDQEYDSHGEVSGRIRKSKGQLAEEGSDKCMNDIRCQASGFRFSHLNQFREGHDKHMKVNGPGKIFVKHVSWDSVDIEWDAVASYCNGDVYQVRYENTKSRKWNCQNFEINSGKIIGLQPGTSYTFKVRLVKSDGVEGKYGQTSKEVTTQLEEPIPGKPLVQHVFADRVAIIWVHVETFCRGDVYEVHAENTDTKENICQTFDINCASIEDLQPDSPYVFKVRVVKQNGQVSKYSENSGRVKTCSTFALNLVRTRCPVYTSDKGTALYELPMTEVKHATNADARSIKFQIGEKGRVQIVEKTIMLLGATGSGKSTFVDSLANYVMGVRLEDPYRFTVTREEDRETLQYTAISQTDWIKLYTFNPQEGTRLAYRLNVIDTPGFGDTRRPKHGKEIVDQILKLFNAPKEKGVQVIDAVCFFFKASECRLTEAQTYIFNAIQSLFGKDIRGNICLLITFADGSVPVVMDCVKKSGLSYGAAFSFNNLSWSADPKAKTTSAFWKMSFTSFTALFNHLKILETKSLQLTKDRK